MRILSYLTYFHLLPMHFLRLVCPIDHSVSFGVGNMLVPSNEESLRSYPNIHTITMVFVLKNYVAFFWIRSENFNNPI